MEPQPNIPEVDLLGNPLTDAERKVAEAHFALERLCRTPDLPPAIRAGADHALAGTWQMMNDLDIPCEPCDEIKP